MSLVQNLAIWPAQRWPWAFLMTSAILFEVIALYFQYGMDLEPCVMCVYQRVAVLGIAIACILPLVNPKNKAFSYVGLSGWLISSFWGAKIAREHVMMQDPENFMLLMSCDVFPNFPDWMPLNHWFPSVFEPRGTCGDIDWQFLSLSMPQWMLGIFGVYFLTAVTFTILATVKK
jgi:protein dithiol:quinone oxidoreductase